MNTPIQPPSLAPPAANYSHAMLVTAPHRWLHTSGVVATKPDGTVPASLAEQVDVIWANIGAMLAAAEMAATDVVSITTYVVDRDDGNDLSVVMAARDRAMAGHKPASTLIVVPRLARPEWRAEVAIVAAS